ncbi:MAG TPA: Ppx/GppA phosphatase family protein [Gaiellaceae bacterium]|jgi:exopolyphosphatase/guanosine-5'-triphosphate,3'-diphosphate pyrophosphatase
MRVAGIDQGTNTTRLLVADVHDGRVEDVHARSEITRLGEGVDARRRLLPVPVARVRNVLTDYRREAERLGAERVLLTATSAVRDAENGEAFLGEVEWSYGFATRLLDGEEEADLTFRGVTSDRRIERPTLVLDIGGGSTELIVAGPGGISSRRSVDIGSVRLTERFLHSDPPTASELEACAAHVVRTIPERLDVEDAIGVAGTITTLAAIELGMDVYQRDQIHGHRLTLEAIVREVARLAELPLERRVRVSGLHPDRAPVIVAGGIVVRETLRQLGLDGLTVSERDILHGIALEAAQLPEPAEGDAPPGAYTCC